MKANERAALLTTLQARLARHMVRHKGIEWAKVQARLEAEPTKLAALAQMEAT